MPFLAEKFPLHVDEGLLSHNLQTSNEEMHLRQHLNTTAPFKIAKKCTFGTVFKLVNMHLGQKKYDA